jgi:LL-diaminopimelate aminotransferase
LRPYPFAVLGQRINEMKADGLDVVRLDMGSPDMPPPDAVIAALENSARHPDHHGYSGYRGTASFREAIAGYYARRFGVKIDPKTEVLPLMGSKEGLVNLAAAYLDSGDLALVNDVYYPSYVMSAHLVGADVCVMNSPAENGYLPELENVPAGIAARAKLLWVNYPNNPTGAVTDVDFYQRAVDFCAANDILLASDNPYVEITFDDYTAPSVLQAQGAKDHAVEFISFSKTYNMAGWRLGAAVGNAEILNNLLRVKSNLDSGHFIAVYDAAVTALETPQDWLDERNLIYQKRRDRILEALPEIGLRAEKPAGSMYVWAQVEQGDGADYAEEALVETNVSIAQGDFYGAGGANYVRFSLGTADHRLDEALHRLRAWHGKKT